MNVGVYSVLSCILALITTARVEFMLLLGSLFLPRAPHLYWSLRGRYARATSRDGTVVAKPVLIRSESAQVDTSPTATMTSAANHWTALYSHTKKVSFEPGFLRLQPV